MSTYISRRSKQFATWWRAPATRADRLRGMVVGGLGGFWLGVIGRVVAGALPVSLGEAAVWAALGAVLGLAVGARFPKAAACILFPMAIFGGGQ